MAWVLTFVSWRRAFEIFGVLGVLWAIAFYRWYRDDPATHPGVNRAELALLPPRSETAAVQDGTPWAAILSSRSVWLLCLQYGCLAYGWWFYVTWLPTYLRDVRGLSLMKGAFYAGLPLFLGGLGCFASAGLSPLLRRMTGSIILSRRLLAITGFVGASISIIVFTRTESPLGAVVMLGLAGFFNDFVMPPAWAGTMDVGGRHAMCRNRLVEECYIVNGLRIVRRPSMTCPSCRSSE